MNELFFPALTDKNPGCFSIGTQFSRKTTCGSGFVQVQFFSDTDCKSPTEPLDIWTALGVPAKVNYNECTEINFKIGGAQETKWYKFTGATQIGAALAASVLAVAASLY